MDPMQPAERPTNFAIQVPPELEGGTYANFFRVWHTGYEFTLDFAVAQPPIPPRAPGDPNSPSTVPFGYEGKDSPALIFDIMRSLNENMAGYEGTFGEIQCQDTTQEGAE
jgi:hypothetical protein